MEDDTLLSSFLSPDKTSLLISTDLLNDDIIRPMLSHSRIAEKFREAKRWFLLLCFAEHDLSL